MGTISKLACGAVLCAIPAAIVATGWSSVASATSILTAAFPPAVEFVGYPVQVKRGDQFTVRGVAFPATGSAFSRVYVTVATDHRNGKAGVQDTTSYVINVAGDAPAPFEIDVKGRGWSGGTIRIGATIVSEDGAGIPTSATAEIEIAVTTGSGK